MHKTQAMDSIPLKVKRKKSLTWLDYIRPGTHHLTLTNSQNCTNSGKTLVEELFKMIWSSDLKEIFISPGLVGWMKSKSKTANQF